MNIDIILTGGTIGTVLRNNDTVLDDKFIYDDLLKNKSHQFKIHSPFVIHSENLVPAHWEKLHNEIQSIKNTDGIIILHGTDTLVNTSAFLSLVHGDTKVPIVLVSANSPINYPFSNAKANFDMALLAIENGAKGVFVSYKNYNEPPMLFLGNKLLNILPYIHKLCSTTKPYAIDNNSFEIIGDNFYEEIIPFKYPMNKVIIIPAMASTDFSFYLSATEQPNAYLVELFHSSTVCISDDFPHHNFAKFIEKSNEKNIKVFLAPFESREYFYPSKTHFNNAIPLIGDTLPMAFTRLLLKNY